jgi:hypothetical protein
MCVYIYIYIYILEKRWLVSDNFKVTNCTKLNGIIFSNLTKMSNDFNF